MKTTVLQQISELKQYAKAHGLEVRFRNDKSMRGDFCIFIYDKQNFRESYAVGYDGSYNSKYGNDFDGCLKSAYSWIEKRDKRFIFRDGHWQYGHYHFIIWRDQVSSDREHYLTIEDADKAAAEYMAQDYAVACYDQTPEGKSRPAKFYGNIQRHANDYVRKQAARLATA